MTATNSRDVSLHAISNEHPGTPTAHVTWKPFINGCAAFNRYIALPTRHLQSNRILHCCNGEASHLFTILRRIVIHINVASVNIVCGNILPGWNDTN